MAIKQFNARITMKRDTAANWEQNNPVLLNGEIIIVDTASGEVRFKIGDGTKLYKQLPFSDEAVRALISAKEDKVSLTENRAVISDASGKLSVSDVTSTELSYLDGVSSNLQTQINNKVPTTRKINSKPLSSDITLSASDVNAVPTTRKINGKALSADITLNASDVGALPSSTTYVSTVDGSSGAVTTNAVKYTSQSLTDAQKTQARTNIGAGTSSFSGSYNDLTNKPTIPDNIVTYDTFTTIEATSKVNADTLGGYSADHFATATDVSDIQNEVNANTTNISGKLDKSGGTMTGALVAQNNVNYTTAQVRNVFISTAEPSGGSNGDIWLQYSE